ncbi:MAG: alpha/beta hydrolase [Acidobacteria bacterium]|nr:alpha/beta hydrolase [Acidobacteriota bacterium]
MTLNNSRRTAANFALVLLTASALVVAACARQSAGAESGQSNQPTAAPAAPEGGAVLRDVPEKIDAAAKYLFYLHGRIIETGGVRPTSPRHGVYEYEQILRTLAARGFTVLSEARPADTEHAVYARKVVGQIERLLKAGVPARNVTVVGASKGGAIAVFTSTFLKNRDVNFVVLAGCGDSGPYRENKVDLHGRVLSIYDADDLGVSCAKYYKQSTGLKQSGEIEVKRGLGHGLLYKPYKEWVDPAVEWANGK